MLYAWLARDAYYFQLRKQGYRARDGAQRSPARTAQELFPNEWVWQAVITAAEDPRTWGLVALYFVSFGGFLALTAWFPTYWINLHHMDVKSAAVLGGVGFSLLAAVIRVFGGMLSERIGGERTAILRLRRRSRRRADAHLHRSFYQDLAGELLIALGMGVGNAAVFKMVPKYVPEAVGGAAGLVGGLGALGGFVIPPFLGAVVDALGTAGYAGGFFAYVRAGGHGDRRLHLLLASRSRLKDERRQSLDFEIGIRVRIMSHFLDRLTFFNRVADEFSDGHGITTNEDRRWEDGYRKRWQHDKIVRSTHGVNCTGSCSWKIYVKGGIVTWETQQTDYPRTRPDLPNHEPRGCARGASYSWYLYSANRVKYPLVRSRLLKLWREARAMMTPVAAWKSIVENPEKRASYIAKRGLGGFVRATWDEVNEIIASANAYTVKTYGPDRVIGFSPIPAMSMVSYAAGSRYLSLIGGVCMSFYDWYCDLPPASPQTWGEQTDVPESADWYNSGFLILWGSNVPQTRTPDAHFYTEVRYQGRQERRDLPGLLGSLEVRRPLDLAEAGHGRGARHGHGPRHPEGVPRRPAGRTISRLRPPYTDMPMLVRLVKQDEH